MKRYSSAELARGFLALREKTSHEVALRCLAAALITGKIPHRLESVVYQIHCELLRHGTALADVVSAHELTSELKKQLTGVLKKLSAASRIETVYRLDAELIGGFVATTPTHTIDASVAGMLNQLTSPLHV